MNGRPPSASRPSGRFGGLPITATVLFPEMQALTMLIKKDVLWHWDPLQIRSSEDLKSGLCVSPLLIYLYPFLPYTAMSDALGDVGGGVLMQDHGEAL